MFETFSLLPGVSLHCRRDTRFKQGCLSLHWVTPMQENTVSQNALIPSVLLRGTRQHPEIGRASCRERV